MCVITPSLKESLIPLQKRFVLVACICDLILSVMVTKLMSVDAKRSALLRPLPSSARQSLCWLCLEILDTSNVNQPITNGSLDWGPLPLETVRPNPTHPLALWRSDPISRSRQLKNELLLLNPWFMVPCSLETAWGWNIVLSCGQSAPWTEV